MSAFNIGASTFLARTTPTIERRETARPSSAPPKEAEGTTVATSSAPTLEPVSKEQGLAAILKWVPGEVLGVYVAVVAVLLARGGANRIEQTAWSWLVIFCLIAALVAWAGGYLAFRKVVDTGKMPKAKRVELAVRAGLASLGLLLWSLAVPGSATNQSGWAAGNADILPLLVPLLAIVFGLLAEMLVLPSTLRWLAKRK